MKKKSFQPIEMLSIVENSFGASLTSFPSVSKIRLCLFDLDSTLIQTKSGKVYPESGDDWQWLYPNLLETIQEKYSHENDLLCIISNQKNLLEENRLKQKEEFERKLGQLQEEFIKKNIRMNYLVSFRDDYYRKPLTGLFHYLKNECKKRNLKIDMSKSFYCGDAAGRVYDSGKKDFGASDLFFAHNCQLTFYIPEYVFLNQPLPTFSFPSRPYLDCHSSKLPTISTKSIFFMMIMGPPASGKSYIGEKIKEKYGGVILETDKVKSKEKMIKKIKEELGNIKSVIVIGTYPKREDREEILQEVKKMNGMNRYGIEMTTSKEMIQHMNAFRVEYSENRIGRIPEVAYRVYNKYYVKPTRQEGFEEIFEIEPCIEFESKKMESIFQQYY